MLASDGSDAARVRRAVCGVLEAAGSPRFVQDMLGMRHTTGSIRNAVPPPLRWVGQGCDGSGHASGGVT